jgi:hypothetical protein
MNKLVAIGTLTLGVGLGALWGYHVGSTESSAPAASVGRPAPVMREGSSAGRADVDPAVLRALIREEMSAVLAAKLSTSSVVSNPEQSDKAAAPSAKKETISAEALEQRREAQQQIDTIMAQGVWGNEQRLSFQQHLVALDREDRERALQRITTAINNGALQVSTDGPPL